MSQECGVFIEDLEVNYEINSHTSFLHLLFVSGNCKHITMFSAKPNFVPSAEKKTPKLWGEAERAESPAEEGNFPVYWAAVTQAYIRSMYVLIHPSHG